MLSPPVTPRLTAQATPGPILTHPYWPVTCTDLPAPFVQPLWSPLSMSLLQLTSRLPAALLVTIALVTHSATFPSKARVAVHSFHQRAV